MKIKNKIFKTLGTLYSFLPLKGIRTPFFIVGCGRSGTTILGKCLSFHPAITYLNECRHLWFSCYPETDIWTNKSNIRVGKLVLTEEDVRPQASYRLRRLFRFETLKTGRPVLIEKLPVNNFRLQFINRFKPLPLVVVP